MKYNHFQSERGIATLIALILVGMLTLIGLAAMSTSDDEVSIAGNELQEMRAFYAAEAGLEQAAAELQQSYQTTGLPPDSINDTRFSLNDCEATYYAKDDGPSVQRQLTSGPMAGLNAQVKTFSINATGSSTVDRGTVVMSQSFETAQVPIFQFAVFYAEMLQTSPAFNMTIDGRVHVNGDMWLNGWSGITFTDKVTCAGSIYHGLENGAESGASANVYFPDAGGNPVNWKSGGSWLDANDSDWFSKAAATWGGNIQDEAFGQEELNLPLTSAGGDSHKIIERASGNPDSYENKATFKIMDGVPYAKVGGAWLDVSGSLAAGTITKSSSTSFYDGHEKKTVQNTQIDMDLLRTSAYFPSNGVIYASDQSAVSSSTMNGLTLSNGDDIGQPLTIVSENPVYVEGDYNVTDKQPASIIADACTFLSNDWAPTNKAKSTSNYSSRPVYSATEVNVSFITGDLEPTSSNYGGGLENLPRFLEHWNGKEFKLRGSMICLWKSEEADGTYKYKGSPGYYSAPTRNWGFDHDLDDPTKLPPETPVVRVFQRVGWKQDFVAYQTDTE